MPGQPYTNGTYSWLWPIVVGAVIQGFWAVAWGSVNSELTRLQKEIDRTNAYIGSEFLRIGSAEEYRKHADDESKHLSQDVLMIRDNLRRLRAEVPSREALANLNDAVKRTNDRVDELRKDFGASYTLSDKIKEFQDQLKALQTQVTQNARDKDNAK